MNDLILLLRLIKKEEHFLVAKHEYVWENHHYNIWIDRHSMDKNFNEFITCMNFIKDILFMKLFFISFEKLYSFNNLAIT